MLYTHYTLSIPNANVRPKLSGNNRITVNFDSDGPKKTRQFAYPSAFYQGLLQL